MSRRLLVQLLPFVVLAGLVLATRPGPGGAPSIPAVQAAQAIPSTDQPVISAQGTGRVTAPPDLLTLVIGVETRAASSDAALKDNANRANALIDTLKRHGVAAKDIATSQLSISPTYDNNGQHITGYQVGNIVTAKVHDIQGAGQLIDAAAGAAGDAVRIQQIAFGFDDDSALLAQARADAVRRAHDQADQMAKAAGVRLGRVRSISEGSEVSPGPRYGVGLAPGAGGAAPTPIEPGTQELTVTVTAVYDVEQ
ncbi:MAG TPA: SIMPL domain-containing protein [Candidatus Dormibacteraeota bacterium]|nr:SIMPL domain-containing protein [Candidatus Dormibacteraeota bacterium]